MQRGYKSEERFVVGISLNSIPIEVPPVYPTIWDFQFNAAALVLGVKLPPLLRWQSKSFPFRLVKCHFLVNFNRRYSSDNFYCSTMSSSERCGFDGVITWVLVNCCSDVKMQCLSH